MKRIVTILVFIMIVVISFLRSLSVSALVPNFSLTTSPVSIDLNMKPGTTSTNSLKLMNNSNQPININMLLGIFAPEGSTGNASIKPLNSNNFYSSWIKFSPSIFTAQPGVWTDVKMTIALPSNASLGYYFTAIFSPAISVQTNKGPHIRGSNAIFLLINSQSANEQYRAKIVNFSVGKGLYEYLPVKFNITIKNQGNIFFAPVGNIYISRSSNFTSSIASLNVNPGGSNILPNSSRVFNTTWSDGFPFFQNKTLNGQIVYDKKGNPIEQLNWNANSSLSKIRIGKYYAQLTIIYNNSGKIVPITSVVSFWVIPWKLMGIGLIILIFVIIGIWTQIKYIRMKYKKRR